MSRSSQYPVMYNGRNRLKRRLNDDQQRPLPRFSGRLPLLEAFEQRLQTVHRLAETRSAHAS